MAKLFNYKFATLGNYEGPTIEYNSEYDHAIRKQFMFRMISEKECLDALKNLDVNKPTGPSTIPAWALNDGLTKLHPHLSFIINAFIISDLRI